MFIKPSCEKIPKKYIQQKIVDNIHMVWSMKQKDIAIHEGIVLSLWYLNFEYN